MSAPVLPWRRVSVDVGLGVAASLISSARGLRPCWCRSGRCRSACRRVVSLLFALTVGVELLLFYPAGSVMDRFGRFWVAVPCAALSQRRAGRGHARRRRMARTAAAPPALL